MHLPGNIRILRTLRRLRSRLRPGIAILGYHRVSDARQDPLGLSTSRANFEAHLAAAARLGKPIRLADAADAIDAGCVPRRGIVFTFDDGYADNLHALLPILERHGVPATVFVTSGNPGGEFWWDRLARLLAAKGRAARAEALATELERLPGEERETHLEALARDTVGAPEPAYRALTAAELKRLASSPLVEIGAHSLSHRRLPELDDASQREETRRSRANLEALLGRPVTSFAYPHGAITARTIDIVGEAGYRVACCSRADVAGRRAPLLALPRLWPSDCPGRDFERWLGGWLHA